MNKNLFFKTFAALSLSAAMLAGAVSCAGLPTEIAEAASSYTIERQDIENYISVSGNVEGTNIVKVTSDLNNKVKELKVEVGSSVKEGDVLCIFDSTELQNEYDTLKASFDKTGEKQQSLHEINQRTLNNAYSDKEDAVAQAQRAIDNAVSARDNAYSKYNSLGQKKDELYNQYINYYNAAYGDEYNEVAERQSEAAYAQYTQAESEYSAMGEQLATYDNAVQDARDAYNKAVKSADQAIQAAKDSINAEKFDSDSSTQNQLDKLKEKIDKCTVKATTSGIVTSIDVAEGSFPSASSIMTIEDTSQLRIKVTVNESDILNVHEGQKAVITTTATGDKEFIGSVDRVVNIFSGQLKDAITGEASGGGYSAEIKLDANSSELLIGMSAKVKIILDEKPDVIAVPYDAIMEDDNGKQSVFIAEGSEGAYTAKKVDVETGMEANYYTEITSDSLKEGDIVITTPNLVKEGEPVTLEDSYLDAKNTEANGD